MARKSTTPEPAKARRPPRANRHSNPSPEPGDSASVAGEISGAGGSTPEFYAAFPIVGVGASAGGLEAFTALLTALPADTGMAFVLIQHMDPHHQSVLTSLLQRATVMPVQEVTDGMPVEPNHVYVIPPNSLMSVSRGVLTLSPRNQPSIRNLPIDHFFQALADDLGSRAIGVVLSGTASDGTQGLRALKERGGVTFAQDKESAQYPGMPLSAIAAGCVDFILPPGRIAIELARINGHPYFRSVHDNEFSLPEGAVRDGIGTVCRLLKTATGVDFHLYKPATIGRRVARRMALRKLSALDEYLQLLTEDRTELNALYEDVFIHVTSFFRDPESLRALQRLVFAKVPSKERSERTIRVWAPGCSSGEEIYSIAILLIEQLGEQRGRAAIQFFGTDISEKAIEQARAGIYPESSLSDVSRERQIRFFNKVDSGFQIAKSVRDLCVFARHDLAKDPPFSKLDLISCRNVLIYMEPVLQKRVVEAFHYALKPDGHLLLGKSESLSAYSNLFSVEDSKHKIFARRPFATSRLPGTAAKRTGAAPPVSADDPPAAAFDLRREAERLLLDRYAPAALVVDPSLQIVQFQGDVGPFLAPGAGEPSFSLLRIVRPELAVGLRAAIHQVKKEGASVRKDGVRFMRDGAFAAIDIQVSPLKGRHAKEFDFLVVFEESAKQEPADRPKPRLTPLQAKERTNVELARRDRELASMQEQLRTMLQDHAAASEEMQAMNEELLSANEELQSTNEELETAKEELESSNEELTTLNDESQKRNVELSQLTDDLNNLLAGVNIPILILDLDLRIRRFTPAAEKVLNLIAADVGRPLSDVASTLDAVDWREPASHAMQGSQVVEREVRDRDGCWYAMRVRPFWTGEQKISGVLIALLDIDAVKRSLDEAQGARDFAEAIVETVREPLLVLDAEFRIIRATPSFYRTFQVSEGDTDGRLLFDLGNGQWNIPVLRDLLLHLLPRDASFESYQVDHDFPSIGHKSMILNARQIHPRAGGGPLILLAIEDVTLREHANRSRLEAARDEERRLIATELHDDLVQQLAGMAMEIGRHAAKPPERPALLKKELRSLQTRVVQAAEVARNVAYKLHPTELDDLGLEAALRLYCENFGQQEGIDVAFTCQGMPPALSRETSYCLYKVAQESLRNIAKHARAKCATVSIEGAAGGIRMRVEDSGVGFSVSSLRGATGLGIVSMKERVQLANGEFSITSEAGKGTRISVNASLREIRR